MQYRPDIDGLRAVSVGLVVLFHAGLTVIPGGFIGVDVFFVISGYLITYGIVDELERGRFSLAAFYERRIRRILPALFLVVATVLAAGLFLLMPGDYAAASRSALAAIGSFSNFYFLNNTGYFDVAADTMPLLHTWSLAVEEQFYFVWPLVLALSSKGFRARRSWIAVATLALILASFMWSYFAVQADPKSAFYLPQTRAWELGVGALLAIIPHHRWPASKLLATGAGFAGLALILWGAVALSQKAPFPGPNALWPVLGATLLIAPWRSQSAVTWALSLPPFVFIGRISYSLYLWHWPIIVLYRHYNSNAPLSWVEATLLVAVSVAISALSWRFIEMPARRAKIPRLKVFGRAFATAAMIVVVAFGVIAKAGLPERIPPELDRLKSLEVMWEWDCPQVISIPHLSGTRCVIGADWETANVRGVFWGDSHQQHFAPLLDRPARDAGLALILIDGCMPLIGGELKRDPVRFPNWVTFCPGTRDHILNFLGRTPDVSVLATAAAWGGYPESLYRNDPREMSKEHGLDLMRVGFAELKSSLPNPGMPWLVIADVASRPSYDLSCLFAGTMILRPPCAPEVFRTPIDVVRAGHGPTNELVRELPQRFPNISVVIPQDAMCDGVGCITTLGGEFLYRDNNHIRRNLTPETKERLVRLLGLDKALAALASRGIRSSEVANPAAH